MYASLLYFRAKFTINIDFTVPDDMDFLGNIRGWLFTGHDFNYGQAAHT
jgi:hypothetical protein